MPTPLDQYASLTIALSVPGTPTTNSRGLETAAATEIVAVCWAKVGNPRSRHEDSNTFTELPLTGYYLAPQLPSAAIMPGVSAPAILWRLSSGFSLMQSGRLRQWASHAAYEAFVEANRARIDYEGTFTLAMTLTSPYILPVVLLGKNLSGIFSVKSQWADVV